MASTLHHNHNNLLLAIQPNYHHHRHRHRLLTRAQSSSTSRNDLIVTRVVRPIPPKDAASAISSEGYRLLDIRPVWEWEKARVKGSIHVPLFVEDKDSSLLTLIKKSVHFGYIGLWTGQLLTTVDEGFVDEVRKAIPDREDKVLVACGEGLRSRIAVSMLHKDGYKNLGWLAGGFGRSKDRDFPEVEGPTKLQYATVGGVSFIFLRLLLLLRVIRKDQLKPEADAE